MREAPGSPPRGWGPVFSAPEGSSASASGRVGAGCRQEAGDASPGVALRARWQLGRGVPSPPPRLREALRAKVEPLPPGVPASRGASPRRSAWEPSCARPGGGSRGGEGRRSF